MHTPPVLLDGAQLLDLSRQLPQWEMSSERGGLLQRNFEFDDFVQAFGFMTQTALLAERMNHHPEWTNVYNRVEVTMITHDAQGITVKDVALAQAMDRIAEGIAAVASATEP